LGFEWSPTRYSGEARVSVETLFSTQQRANVGRYQALVADGVLLICMRAASFCPDRSSTALVAVGGRRAVVEVERGREGGASHQSGSSQSMAWSSSASARSNITTVLRPPACRRTTAVRGAAGFIRPSPGSQSLSGGFAIGLVVDELAGGNHRRGRAVATPGGGI
jgi:hypothetical protein